jgi:hypothetical protein
MPMDAYPRVLAGELIGSHGGGYNGLEVLKGLEGGFQVRIGAGFYREAKEAWSALSIAFLLLPDVQPKSDYPAGRSSCGGATVGEDGGHHREGSGFPN